MAEGKKWVYANIALTPEEKERLKALAEREHRSLRGQVMHMVAQAEAAEQ